MSNRERLVAQSNAERQRNHKERLKQKAAEGAALAELMLENQRAMGEYITRLERVVLQAEGGVTEHDRPAAMLSLPPDEVERLLRIKQIQCFREDGHIEPKSQTYRFLGMSAQQWLGMPDELLSVFGLVEVAAEWRRQMNASIAIDRARQPEDRDIERFLAEEANHESEISHGRSQTQEDISSAVASSGFVEKRKVDWSTLDWAHSEWCFKQNPEAPSTPAERYALGREDRFHFDGALWVTKVRTITFTNGTSETRADFFADDGREFLYPERYTSL